VPTVTSGQKKQLATLDAQWNEIKTEMNDLIAKDIAAYNKLCAEKVISKVIIP
jgi:formiminotetrahydrofolate cyclodeaminase